VGSLDPPLRTTFLGGGHGGKVTEPAFAESAFAKPVFAESALEPELGDEGLLDVDPAAFGFPESVGLATGFSAVAAVVQLGTFFLLRRRCGLDGFAGLAESPSFPSGEGEACGESVFCVNDGGVCGDDSVCPAAGCRDGAPTAGASQPILKR
jgi:hypothetical protein